MKKLCLTFFALATALAGADPSVRSGTIEITGFGGVNAKLPGAEGGQLSQQVLGINPPTGEIKETHPSWGGAIGLATGHHVMLLGEFMYGPLGSAQFSAQLNRSLLSVKETSSLYEFTGGLQYMLRAATSRMAPYIGGAFGGVRMCSRISLAAPPGMIGGASSATGDNTKVTGNLAAGVRLHVSDRFGIRPEFRVMRIPGKTYLRAEAGVFYQFRK